MNILRESMTKMTVWRYVIRIWRQERDDNLENEPGALETEVYKAVAAVEIRHKLSIAKAILALPNINAVEVLDENGNGEVLYRCDEVMIGDKRITII